MRAAVLKAIKQPLSVETVPDPSPGPGQAAVRVRAAALNHRDLWIRLGQYAQIRLPQILGSDGAGMVAAVGAGVDPTWAGREVIVNPSLDWGDDPRAQGASFRILGMPDPGTFAEAVVVPAANLVPKPGHLGWEQAAALPLAGLTAWRALFTRARLQAGERVLVTGIGGGVALTALQLAVAAGATVWVTSGSSEKLARARALGAAGGVSYREADWAGPLTRAAGGPFDVVLDSAGGDGFGALIELTRPGGRIAFYGATAGNPGELNLRKCFFRQISLLGSTMGSPADFAALVEFVGRHRLAPVIDRGFPLAEAEAAFRHLEAGGHFGKVVLAG